MQKQKSTTIGFIMSNLASNFVKNGIFYTGIAGGQASKGGHSGHPKSSRGQHFRSSSFPFHKV